MQTVLDRLNLTLKGKPRGDRLIVLPLIQASSSIIVDMEENREKPTFGIVLSVGPGGIGSETGREVPVLARPGQLVAFGRYAGLAIDLPSDGKVIPALIMRDSEVLLEQEPGTYELEFHEDGDLRHLHEKGLTCEYCARETGEEGVTRLRELAYGEPTDEVNAVAAERARVAQETT